MKKKLIIFIAVCIIIIIGFLAIRRGNYDASQSQCEHYQNDKRQQESIQYELQQ